MFYTLHCVLLTTPNFKYILKIAFCKRCFCSPCFHKESLAQFMLVLKQDVPPGLQMLRHCYRIM